MCYPQLFYIDSNYFDQARDVHPYLARFENDWATADIVKQYMRNRRKYMARQSRRIASGSKLDRALKARNMNADTRSGGEEGDDEDDGPAASDDANDDEV
jgi:hypothetical protein